MFTDTQWPLLLFSFLILDCTRNINPEFSVSQDASQSIASQGLSSNLPTPLLPFEITAPSHFWSFPLTAAYLKLKKIWQNWDQAEAIDRGCHVPWGSRAVAKSAEIRETEGQVLPGEQASCYGWLGLWKEAWAAGPPRPLSWEEWQFSFPGQTSQRKTPSSLAWVSKETSKQTAQLEVTPKMP